MKLREDGWPVTDEDESDSFRSNLYIGFQKDGRFASQGAEDEDGKFVQGWLDQQALQRVKAPRLAPISYYDAVLEVQIGVFPFEPGLGWIAVTYGEVQERNLKVDAAAGGDVGPTKVWITTVGSDGDGKGELLRVFDNVDEARLFVSLIVDLLEE